MESIQHINKEEEQQQGFDEETKQKIQAYLEEIDTKHQQQQSSQKTTGWRSYISFHPIKSVSVINNSTIHPDNKI